MLFNSLHFFFFSIIVIPLYFTLDHKRQKQLLLVSSLYFYGSLKIAFVPLIVFSFTATWILTNMIHRNKKHRNPALAASLLINLGILATFKYTDFFRSSVYDLGTWLGIEQPPFEAVGFILPLGISFYTFQAVAYTVDVYRGQIKPEKSYHDFFLFLLFFPQLVAGPIMRATQLIPQFAGRKVFSAKNLELGIPLVVLGIFKKSMIADPIADIIDPIFAAPGNFDSSTLFIADVFFTFQIYCDFSGYSDIAIGIGKIMGFDIPLNFNRPYLSASITELWRRWHISLSTWLKDYVYISLGGNRVSRFRNYVNVSITMVVGGFWHGAAWTFVIWGAFHAIILNIERYFIERGWNRYFSLVPKPVKILHTFLLFIVGAHFFRSNSLELAITAGTRIFTLADGTKPDILQSNILIPVLVLFLLELAQEFRLTVFSIFEKNMLLRYSLFISVILIALMIYSVTVSPKFYYFQF